MDHHSPRLTGAWVTLFPDGQLMSATERAQDQVFADRTARTFIDDSARHLAASERALEVERQRREDFVAILAHELRQPLSALLVCVELGRLAPGSAAADRATRMMKRQIGQMSRLIEDLMDAARWARGKVTIRKERIDVRTVVIDAVDDVQAAVAERGHELVVAQATDPLWTDADPQRLQQVFTNLLRNAVKYTDHGGRIWLETDREEASVKLRIGDTGRGIEADALPQIFDLYTQVRPSEAAGLGLGLSVAREIVELHEGRIEARSDGLGCGSEFIVTLPLADAQDG